MYSFADSVMIFRGNKDMPMDLNLSWLSRTLNGIFFKKKSPLIKKKKNLQILQGYGKYKWEEVTLILLSHLILNNNQ